MSGMVSLDAMRGAAGYVGKEWGEYGYSIAIESGSYGGLSAFTVRSGDGGEFRILSDHYGNASTGCARPGCFEQGEYEPLIDSGSYLCSAHALAARDAR